MRLNLLISAILLSTTALSAADAVNPYDQGPAQGYVFEIKQGIESGYALIQGNQTLVTVFTSKVVRTEPDFVVCETNNSLSHAFVPTSEGVLRQWVDGVEFLLETLDAGLVYSQSLEDQRSAGSVPKMRAADPAFLNRLFGIALDIHQKLKNGPFGFLPEDLLNSLYLDIMSAIDEIQQDTNPLSRHLIDSMYVPVRDWIKVNIPVCQMYEYVRPQVTTISGGQTKIEYFLEAKRYFDGYVYQTDQYKKIRVFAENNPAERENFQLELWSFIKSTSIELHGSETNSDPTILYVRFLEGVKQREVAFIETWISKVLEEEAKLDARRAQLAAHALAEKARKERDPKTMAEEMMRAMGLNVEPQPAQQKNPKSKKPTPVAKAASAPRPKEPMLAIEETAPVAKAVPATSVMSEADRLANLAANEEKKAEHKRGQEERQKILERRKQEAAENEAMVRAALLKRQDTWLEKAFNTKLAPFDPSKQVSLKVLNTNPNFETVSENLRSIGCYVDTNIHGNEKGIARWVGADRKKVMVWFDRPHGAQLKMGVAAGWFKSLVKRLRETGKLAE